MASSISKSTGIVWSERFAWHDSGRASSNPWAEPYPALDRPESKRRIWSLLEASGLAEQLLRIAPRPATEEELLRFHTRAYLERLRALSDARGGEAGENAHLGPNGLEIASLAAGAAIEATDAVLSGKAKNAYALVRPCGHHAEPDRGRGFCIFGNLVLAAAHARALHGVERIAVIDWDVHHGNGTELAFYEDPNVLTISLHQEGYYPSDSGAVSAIGKGRGEGANINIPLPAGSGHGAYLAAFESVIVPAVERFKPELILVACGFDAAASDPLGRMLCHSGTFRAMTDCVLALAKAFSSDRLVLCQEGGYSPTYAPFCGLAVVEQLSGIRSEVTDPLLGWYANLEGQALRPHQAAVIESLSARLKTAA